MLHADPFKRVHLTAFDCFGISFLLCPLPCFWRLHGPFLLHPIVCTTSLSIKKFVHLPPPLNVIRGRVCPPRLCAISMMRKKPPYHFLHIPFSFFLSYLFLLPFLCLFFLFLCQRSNWRTLCASSTSSTSCTLFSSCTSFGILPAFFFVFLSSSSSSSTFLVFSHLHPAIYPTTVHFFVQMHFLLWAFKKCCLLWSAFKNCLLLLRAFRNKPCACARLLCAFKKCRLLVCGLKKGSFSCACAQKTCPFSSVCAKNKGPFS